MTDEERLIHLIVRAKIADATGNPGIVDLVRILERDLAVLRGEVSENPGYVKEWTIDKIEKWTLGHLERSLHKS